MSVKQAIIFQWGEYLNQRPGIKNDHLRAARLRREGLIPPESDFAGWADEPDVVTFRDYRYWIRLRPNPGFNLPLVGYWSKAHGRKRPLRPWERS